MYNSDLFEGAAAYYVKHRRPYPAQLFQYLNNAFDLHSGHVLDLGAGTGLVGIPISKFALSVLCVDPDPSMLGQARAAQAEEKAENVEFQIGRSDDVGPRLGKFRLVTMGQSFHYMSRAETLHLLSRSVDSGGGVVVIDKERLVCQPNGWFDPLWNFVDHWHGDRIPAGKSGTRLPLDRSHEDVMRASPFSSVELVRFPYTVSWTVDDLIGYVLSTSRACPGVLGLKQTEFETGLRSFLLNLSKDGVFVENGNVMAIIGRRPSAPQSFQKEL
ncbi:putative methyltransferase [Ensifer psoraleae]|uniref:class I SAM-dependent methyltransferase n=1 Tax=Sinorhizobium psoraleae TaxID=520838 RepID=UPI001569E39E|nr:class I SAM-dependent methyltransferase [Sinorhizobium psoraleae]NRP70924.1 putative methyltransferase [Sinorhizobium psoraleae]